MKTKAALLSYIQSKRIISTHNHHLPDHMHKDMSLHRILSGSYVNWMTPPPDLSDADAVWAYIRRFQANSFFRWLFAALEDLYGLPFVPENLAEMDARIRKAYEDSGYHLRLLTDRCRFDKVVNERQPDPGSNLGHPELLAPSFRCDCFFSGYLKDKPEPNGFLARSLFENPDVATMEEYLSEMRQAILAKKAAGCVALKVAIAYERPINFENTDLEKAQKALNNPHATEQEVLDFGDVVMFEIAKIAAEADLPLQIHTGMGQCKATNPLGLLKLIETNRETKFHLLHGGFPWFEDSYALLLQFRHVWSDLCWIPYLSTTAAKQYLKIALEAGDAHRFTWGCDTWLSEDSVGALLAMEDVLSSALSEMVDDGAFDMAQAEYLVDRILYDNPVELFKL
jgi:hypothetical protein